MKVQQRLITDLEEEILFLLSIQKTDLPVLAIADRVCDAMNKIISLAHVYEALIQLEAEKWIHSVIANTKRNYKITPEGLAALQMDWSFYSRNLYGS